MADQQDPVVVRDLRRQPVPGWVWLLVIFIVLAFALGILLVTSGLLGTSANELPGPTAFTLTPQVTQTPGG
jgi:hypothetical protein